MADTTPGDNQLKAYWTRGAGLAKWATSPHPWTTLYNHLVKFLGPERARRVTSAWFEDVFGYPPSARGGRNPTGPG